jgi:hypothetical protein
MEVERKGEHLNTLETCYILVHKLRRSRLHTIDAHDDIYNPIFEALHELYTRLRHAHNTETKSRLANTRGINTQRGRRRTQRCEKYEMCTLEGKNASITIFTEQI